ncbi:MAG: helix-turn-helix transcriptional regulator, partial [Lentisphaeria bacterium]|nr:helix-turn-helix transcriptional regulator [Lentisphaeria bacterium]
SISRFRTLFKEVFQISFASYELKHRLKGAAEDILYGRLTVKDAAWQWGFFDTSHFSRLFKQYFACTPGKYREKFFEENK